tara:strand:+ start:110 stop:364 length:255 start_codon:yes stop_codon:yes gene_type:complete
MSDDVRAAAQAEAEKTYKGFLQFSKYITYGALAFLLIVASCNFGVEEGPNATGSKYDPSLYEEYMDRIEEMNENIKKKKYGGGE